MLLRKGNFRLSASDGEYNMDTEQGKLRNISLTTCTSERPDYHITAGEATLLPNHRIKVRKVALYLGRTRVMSLPWMKYSFGARGGTTNILPHIGFDSRDGLVVSQTFRLTDTDRSNTKLDLALTTLHSLQGAIQSEYAVGGKLIDFPGRYLSEGQMRARSLNFPPPPIGDCDPQLLRPTDAARLRPFGTFTIRQRAYDAKSLGLMVYRQPELGATYTGSQLSLTGRKLDPRLEIYPQITATIGNYKEVPGHVQYLGRYQIAAQGALNTVWLGPSTAIQPIGMISYSRYSEGQEFRTYGMGLDAAHITRNGSFYCARYLSRTSSGASPFLFDNIDLPKELDLACRVNVGTKILGLGMTFNGDTGRLFDWAVMLGHRTDCLSTTFRWDNKYRRLSADIVLINM